MTQKKQTTTPGTPPSRRRPDSGDIALFAAITLLGASLDLWSKHAVFDWLMNSATPEYSLIDGLLRFILAENTGAAFSLFAGMKWVFVAIGVIALVVIQMLFLMGKLTPRLMLAAVSCINAGIVGNLYDRLFNEGRVRDFIDVYVGSRHWPTFNVADSLLCVGVGILLVLSFTAPDKK